MRALKASLPTAKAEPEAVERKDIEEFFYAWAMSPRSQIVAPHGKASSLKNAARSASRKHSTDLISMLVAPEREAASKRERVQVAVFKASLEAEFDAAERETTDVGSLSDDEHTCFGHGAYKLRRGKGSALQVGVESCIPRVLVSTAGLRHHM